MATAFKNIRWVVIFNVKGFVLKNFHCWQGSMEWQIGQSISAEGTTRRVLSPSFLQRSSEPPADPSSSPWIPPTSLLRIPPYPSWAANKQKTNNKQTKNFVLALPEQMLRLSVKPAKPTFPFLPKRTLHMHCILTKKISCDREKRQIHHTYSLDLLILHY